MSSPSSNHSTNSYANPISSQTPRIQLTLIQPQSQRPTIFATQGRQYAKLYIDLLRKLQRVDTVQAVLVAINDMLSDTTTIPHFHSLSSKEYPEDPYGPIVKCLSMEEEFAVLGSLRILALLIS